MIATKKNRMIFTSIAGLLLATFGIVYVIFFDEIFKFTLKSLMVLKPNSAIAELWQNPDLGMTLDLYLFNWTNADDFRNQKIKPKFEELGPYRFIEKTRKTNVKWNPENATVSYVRDTHFYFDQVHSAGTMDDHVIAPNLLAAGVYNKIRHWSPMTRTFVDVALKMYGNKMAMGRSADELLFKGYNTALMKLTKSLPISIPDLDLPYEKLAYGYPRNHTPEVYGYHNVYTGADDFSKLGQIARWRYQNRSVAFPQCAPVHGSTGEFHPLPLQVGKPISYFLPDLCRTMDVEYADQTVMDGIPGYRYVANAQNLANGPEDSEYQCHCAGPCKGVYPGMMNISSCWFDTPVFASYPHFYKSDPYYAEQVEGMAPSKEKHEMSAVLEPTTGMLLDLRGRLQLNMLVQPMPFASIFPSGRSVFFPLAWADYNIHISPDLAFLLRLLPVFIIAGKVLGIIFVAIGMLLMVWYPRKLYWKPRYTHHRIDVEDIDKQNASTQKSYAKGSPLLASLLQGGELKSWKTKPSRTRTCST